MATEREIIDGIHTYGLNTIPTEQLDHAASVFGTKFLEPADGPTIDRAREYLHGPVKRFLDWGFSYILYGSLARKAEGWVRQVEKIDPTAPGIFELDVGFVPGRETIRIKKIRTMRDGVFEAGNGLFDVASVVSDHKYVAERILPGILPRKLRSWRDEIFQLPLVFKGLMSLSGPRAFHTRELDVNRALTAYPNNPKAGNDKLVKYILNCHDGIMLDQGALPSIINLRGVLIPDLTSHMLRMLLNVRYAEHASREIDTKLIRLSVSKRLLGNKNW